MNELVTIPKIDLILYLAIVCLLGAALGVAISTSLWLHHTQSLFKGGAK